MPTIPTLSHNDNYQMKYVVLLNGEALLPWNPPTIFIETIPCLHRERKYKLIAIRLHATASIETSSDW